MWNTIRSLGIWSATVLLIVSWLPWLSLVRLFDGDPVHYRTGRWFRRLGKALTKINPFWKLEIDGYRLENPKQPLVVVCNHQSLADIPLISNLPWEMKWLAKKELFKLPVVGWMMQMVGDISVDRETGGRRHNAIIKALAYLKQDCPVMFFPEGTRTPDGRVHNFTDGAFLLAIKAGAPVLPLAIDGSRECLPKRSWRFGHLNNIRIRIMEPVQTKGLKKNDVPSLRDKVRNLIIDQIADWRNVNPSEVDGSRGKIRSASPSPGE